MNDNDLRRVLWAALILSAIPFFLIGLALVKSAHEDAYNRGFHDGQAFKPAQPVNREEGNDR